MCLFLHAERFNHKCGNHSIFTLTYDVAELYVAQCAICHVTEVQFEVHLAGNTTTANPSDIVYLTVYACCCMCVVTASGHCAPTLAGGDSAESKTTLRDRRQVFRPFAKKAVVGGS